jgi:heme oxygenase
MSMTIGSAATSTTVTQLAVEESISAAITTTSAGESKVSSDDTGQKTKQTLDPQMVHSDKMRALHEKLGSRQSMSYWMMEGFKDEHKAVENSPFVLKLKSKEATKEEYVQYLSRLYDDLYVMESLISSISKDPHLNKLNFTPLIRSENIAKDLRLFTDEEAAVSDKNIGSGHHERFVELSLEKPYLLAAHLSVRYLAVLYGGQMRANRLKRMWGEETPLNLYRFDEDPKTIRTTFMEELNQFGEGLSDEEYKIFVNELRISWEFAGDIVGSDIRKR